MSTQPAKMFESLTHARAYRDRVIEDFVEDAQRVQQNIPEEEIEQVASKSKGWKKTLRRWDDLQFNNWRDMGCFGIPRISMSEQLKPVIRWIYVEERRAAHPVIS